MEDSKILSMLWDRAEGAIEALAREFGKRLLNTAQNILNSQQDAEECVNDTYWAVWNRIPPLRPEPLAGFVYKTGRNIALKRLRDQSAQKRNSSYDLSLDELAGAIGEADLLERLEARELGQAIDRFLSQVTPDSRVIFLRRYWFGDSVKEIARATGRTENAVSVRLSRLREQLRTYLKQEGFL